MKKKILTTSVMIILILMIAVPVHAASSYKTVNETKTKYGSYYIWRQYNTQFKIQSVETGKIGTISKQAYSIVGVTNGSTLYYTSLKTKWDGKVTLYKYILKTGKETKITTIPDALHIEGYYKGYVYGNSVNPSDGKANKKVYEFKIKTKKKTNILSGYWLERADGRYLYLKKGGISSDKKYRYDIKTKKLIKYEWKDLY